MDYHAWIRSRGANFVASKKNDRPTDDDIYVGEAPELEIFNVLAAPYWVIVFFLSSIPFFILAMFIGGKIDIRGLFPEQLYGIYALLAGTLADQAIRHGLKVSLVILRKPRVPFVLFWWVGCTIVIAFQPLKPMMDAF